MAASENLSCSTWRTSTLSYLLSVMCVISITTEIHLNIDLTQDVRLFKRQLWSCIWPQDHQHICQSVETESKLFSKVCLSGSDHVGSHWRHWYLEKPWGLWNSRNVNSQHIFFFPSSLSVQFNEVCTKNRKAILTSKRVRDLVERWCLWGNPCMCSYANHKTMGMIGSMFWNTSCKCTSK